MAFSRKLIFFPQKKELKIINLASSPSLRTTERGKGLTEQQVI